MHVTVSQGLLEINKIIIHCYIIVISKTDVFKAITATFFPDTELTGDDHIVDLELFSDNITETFQTSNY